MQKCLLLLLISVFSVQAYTQRSIDSMIQAEKNFANTSLVAGTRAAFMKFIDSSGIVFEKGKPVNGLEAYTEREIRLETLTWETEYTEIAVTNDVRYLTLLRKY